VLSDEALTQRILRLSNTAHYRTASGTNVTTISRAISLLGFDNVKTSALAMLLVDALADCIHSHNVRSELEMALCASLVGRELARHSLHQGADEAVIGALFKNLGPLLVAAHEHERYREICALAANGAYTLAQASQMILGCSYETLAEAVLSGWNVPDEIVRALTPLAPGTQDVAVTRVEWMRQVASFGMDVSVLLAGEGNASLNLEDKQLQERYGGALNLAPGQMRDLFDTVREAMASLLHSMNLDLQSRPFEPLWAIEKGLPNVLLLATMGSGESAIDGCHPSGKPFNARDLLLAGVQDVTQMRASGQNRANELIVAVLETLYRSMGFRFAAVCLKDGRTQQYRARLAFGEKHAERLPGFVFPLDSARDIFHLAMENDSDLMIADADTPKIRDLLPAWHRELLPDAKCFMVLPLVVGKARLGLFYADRAIAAPEGVPPDETSLIKALKGQVLLALTP